VKKYPYPGSNLPARGLYCDKSLLFKGEIDAEEYDIEGVDGGKLAS
jgi:hypothetical protein